VAVAAALNRAESILRSAQLPEHGGADGWSPSFATFLTDSLGKCWTEIEAGWTPPPSYCGQWIRLLIDEISFGDNVGSRISAHSVSDSEELPGARHSFELLLATVLEFDIRSGHKINHGSRCEDLVGLCLS